MNDRIVSLPNPIPSPKPGIEPRRPPKPVNVTVHAKLSPTVKNHIIATWNIETGKTYCIAVYLVQKFTANQLLSKLSVRETEYTRRLIRDKLTEDTDSDIATTSLRVSLLCPLSKCRMVKPCRSVSCHHFQCFDGLSYLQMNEKKPKWACPVCHKRISYDDLVIDGYFQEVIDSVVLPSDAVEVQLLQDGSWSPQKEEKETQQKNPECESQMILDGDDVVATDASTSFAKESSSASTVKTHDTVKNTKRSDPKKKAAIVDLTVSSDEEQEESPPTTVASTSADFAPPISPPKQPDNGDVDTIDLTDE